MVIIQRIRNRLSFPDATPLQLLSIRELPESLTDVDDLLGFEKDVLSVAWKKEDEDASKMARARKLQAESLDGKNAMWRIKRNLDLSDSATAADILSVSKLPDVLTSMKDMERLITALGSISWEHKVLPQVRKLLDLVHAATAPEPADIPLPPSPQVRFLLLDDTNRS
jgi:hypothetical protein